MNIGEFRKAIAGGVAGAVAALGGTGAVAVTANGVPGWEQYVLTAVGGFIVGFVAVYVPQNDAPSK